MQPEPARELFWIDDFVSAACCAAIREELQFAWWQTSGVTRYGPSGLLRSVRSPNRVSETALETWFSSELRRILRRLDRRLERLLPHFAVRREPWQATRYPKGGGFRWHFDCGPWASEPAGDRRWTVLLYLDTPRRGGSTRFRELEVEVLPRAGRLLVWRNLDARDQPDPAMLHASMPLRAGSKTTLVTWVRQRRLG